jgi:hypothetical protein
MLSRLNDPQVAKLLIEARIDVLRGSRRPSGHRTSARPN